MSRDTRYPVLMVSNQADTNRPVQSQKKIRSLKFCILRRIGIVLSV